jgi:hypothetical protein
MDDIEVDDIVDFCKKKRPVHETERSLEKRITFSQQAIQQLQLLLRLVIDQMA